MFWKDRWWLKGCWGRVFYLCNYHTWGNKHPWIIGLVQVKFTGNPHISSENLCFSVDLSLHQTIDSTRYLRLPRVTRFWRTSPYDFPCNTWVPGSKTRLKIYCRNLQQKGSSQHGCEFEWIVFWMLAPLSRKTWELSNEKTMGFLMILAIPDSNQTLQFILPRT